MIREAIVTTANEVGSPHIAPLGLINKGAMWILAPFKPSKTLQNLEAYPRAIANLTDDAQVFAGCVTGRRDWPLLPTRSGFPPRLAAALSHWEMEVVDISHDEVRPRFLCKILKTESHKPYAGHSRAFAAVVEGAVLVSRLHLLPRKEIEAELSRLSVLVEKTASPEEREAFMWLQNAVAQDEAASCK